MSPTSKSRYSSATSKFRYQVPRYQVPITQVSGTNFKVKAQLSHLKVKVQGIEVYLVYLGTMYQVPGTRPNSTSLVREVNREPYWQYPLPSMSQVRYLGTGYQLVGCQSKMFDYNDLQSKRQPHLLWFNLRLTNGRRNLCHEMRGAGNFLQFLFPILKL